MSMHAGAITALTFRKLKQITIKRSLGVGKNTLHRAVSDSTAVYMFHLLIGMKYGKSLRNLRVKFTFS